MNQPLKYHTTLISPKDFINSFMDLTVKLTFFLSFFRFRCFYLQLMKAILGVCDEIGFLRQSKE